ncbi:GIY-YIG nuclease family protein, partial [Turicibacter sanguinis]|nr:GIY-YIG nuclease family protein [Turicibacter sanguinis]
RSEACKRESEIKRLKREEKLELIKEYMEKESINSY